MQYIALAVLAPLVAIGILAAIGRVRFRLPRVTTAICWIVIAFAASWIGSLAFNLLTNRPVMLEMPAQRTVELPPGADAVELPASFEWANYNQVIAEATDLSARTTVFLLLGAFAWFATTIGVCLVIIRLSRSLDQGDPFALGSAALGRLSWIVLVGGFAGDWLWRYGVYRASADLFDLRGEAEYSDIAELYDLGWPFVGGLNLPIPLGAIGASIFLALLAAVFRYGAKLRRDTEGLV